MHALLLRGWTVVHDHELPAALEGWRRTEPAKVPNGQWCVVQPVDADQPIGIAHRVVVVSAAAEVDLIPGSQGTRSAPPPGIQPVCVRLVDGDALVLDARCWLRLAERPGKIVIWETA